MSLEVWKSEHGSASGRTQVHPPTDTSAAALPLLAVVSELADEDAGDPPSMSGASPVAPAKCIAGGRHDVKQVGVGVKSTPTGEKHAEEEQPTMVEPAKEASAGKLPSGDQPAVKPTTVQSASGRSAREPTTGERSAGTPTAVQQNVECSEAGEDGGEQLGDEESTDSDVVEVQPRPRRSGQARRPPDFLSYHACVPLAACTTLYDNDYDDLAYDAAEDDVDLLELDRDVHADPEHRWDIAKITVKHALGSQKGKAVKAAMDEEIRSLIANGTWELMERPRGINIMKNCWVLMTKYYVDDTVERKKARLVVKGFTQVIVAILDLNLMQLDMKNAFLQSKLDRVLYMYQPDYYNDGTHRVCKLLKSLYELKQSPLLWYLALGAAVGRRASRNTAMLKELKELLEAAFELREISPAEKYLGLEIVRDRPARKLWLHQQGYADKLRRRFIDEEQTGSTPKTPVSIGAYAEQKEEEEYRQKVGSLQFTTMTMRPDIACACSKLGSGLTVRSDQHWREVDRCLAYLTNTRDTTLEFRGRLEMLELVGYVDADDASDKQNRTSTISYVFVYGGAAVSWSSQRIKCATLSSTESEYVVATEVGKEGRRLCFLLAEFRQLDVGTPTVLWVYSKSAITIAEGMGLTGNLKHMERRYALL
ncbi:unnamed protein product [Closterium sp. Yama58-4]|nr:unnamed protein product [Closterium sp. Yama58-4]